MYGDWQYAPQQEETPINAGDISAAIRGAEDAEWELDEDLHATEPFDPFADDPE